VTRGFMLVIAGMLAVLLLGLLLGLNLQLARRAIDSDEAAAIALNHVRSSPYSANIDTTRVSTRWREDIQAYEVDFAWEAAGQIRPDLWAGGYVVIVHSGSGHVRAAHAYER
jgi:predicted lipid-binding transport protein (Tim44 family)